LLLFICFRSWISEAFRGLRDFIGASGVLLKPLTRLAGDWAAKHQLLHLAVRKAQRAYLEAVGLDVHAAPQAVPVDEGGVVLAPRLGPGKGGVRGYKGQGEDAK